MFKVFADVSLQEKFAKELADYQTRVDVMRVYVLQLKASLM
jgi:hypothetical protein